MDKPINMPVREYLSRLLSIKKNIPLKTIEAVVSHQFQSANEALKDNSSIEISGFGKLLFNHKKAYKKWEKNLSKKQVFETLLSQSTTDQKKASYTVKLENTIKWLENIKPKLEKHGYDTSSYRGLEKQVDSLQRFKTLDRTDLSGENGDLQTMSSILGEQEKINRLDN